MGHEELEYIFKHKWLQIKFSPNFDLFILQNAYGGIARSCNRWWHLTYGQLFINHVFAFKQ
jgi:hypothetical protein